MSVCSLLGVPVGLSFLLASVSVLAQDPARRTDPARPASDTTLSTTTGQTSQNDKSLAAWLIVDNENEIALAQLAQERAKSDEVKQFAKRMLDDHRQMVTKLQKFAGASIGTTPGAASGTARDREGTDASGKRDNQPPTNPPTTTTPPTTPPGTTTPPRGEGKEHAGHMQGQTTAGNQIDIVGLKRELGRKCLTSAKQMLEQKTGDEFDRCYMHMAVGAHVAAVDTIEVFRNHASGEFRQALSEGLPTVQAHLDHAKMISQKLDGAGAHKTDKRGDGGNR